MHTIHSSLSLPSYRCATARAKEANKQQQRLIDEAHRATMAALGRELGGGADKEYLSTLDANPAYQRFVKLRRADGDRWCIFSGAILSEEASTLASIISSFVKTVELNELETRLVALEKASADATGAPRFDA
jgi:hypothetical protein